MKRIAKIVSSNSHIDYVARVLDSFDIADAPRPEDCEFGDFVVMPLENGTEIVGTIYNSLLVNPEYASYGPRLSPKPDLGSFSPDYLNEQGVLLGILLLGTFAEGDKVLQSVPRQTVPAGQDVFGLKPERFATFHRDTGGSVSIHYFSQVLSQAGPFAVPLLELVIDRLSGGVNEQDRRRLDLLKRNLSWQRTVGGTRL